MSNLNILLKQMPEDCNYAIQTFIEDSQEWRLYPLDGHCHLKFITTLARAEQELRAIGLPARLVKISRYVPFGGQEILVHSVLKQNAAACKRK
jgi:hypothetical protein